MGAELKMKVEEGHEKKIQNSQILKYKYRYTKHKLFSEGHVGQNGTIAV